MKSRSANVIASLVLGIVTSLVPYRLPAADTPAGESIRYNRDIRPILADNCFACHGNDKAKRKADLRLDQEAGALAERHGIRAITPHQPEKSELLRRVQATDESERMPPASFGKKLSARDMELLRKWIAAGARYEPHWSLIPPERPALPEGSADSPIDRFIDARLRAEGLRRSPRADRRTLLRRLSFDLTGLPPSPDEVDGFLADAASDAWEKQVDRLLASPHYGERMAIYWLDLVRYADTIGYHSDNPRDIAPYRDWVINAFNANQPFDQFTIEQLAGDLLPNPSLAQKVASGYNRLLQTTEEGGAQPKEYQAKYLADRVRNFGSVWLGATLGCAECHDHKFDPFSMRDFYSLEAFFADIREAPVGRREPGMLVPTPDQEQALKDADARIAAVLARLQAPRPEHVAAALAVRQSTFWFDPALPEFLAQQRNKAQLLQKIPRSLVTVAQAPREIRILPRGNWLDDSGEVVQPAVPAVFQAAPMTQGSRASRLDLARWLVSPQHPLTSRVFVNRVWKLFFGQGLVRSLEDFGVQGEWPSHPELLDWLAVEFRESGWDVKRLVKLMVMSETYQQTSVPTKELRDRDPDNRLLGRQARFRIDAELVRDNALAVSGLLVKRVGGESVKPYQPSGYWDYLNFPRRTWQHDRGDAQYRRGLYTHWQRSFLHPSLLAFDAPSREECTCERPRSNIPQQALVLLNDPSYVEAARVFAERVVREGGPTDEAKLAYAYRRALQRQPLPDEEKILLDLLRRHEAQFQADPKAAGELLKTGEAKPPTDLALHQVAAWTSVTRTLLNLHESINRE